MGKSYQVKMTLLPITSLYVKLEQRYSYPCKRVHNSNLQHFEIGKIVIILKIKVLKGGRCLFNIFGKSDPLKNLRLAQGIKNVENLML